MNYDKALEVISDDIVIQFHDNDWETKYRINYFFEKYNFSENLKPDIECNFYSYRFTVNILLGEFRQVEKNFKIKDDDDILLKIKEVIKFVYDIKNKYEYSKILDKFVLKENKNKKEELFEASCILKHEKIEDCCVCYDSNIVETKCGHNLCRVCNEKMLKIDDHPKCPLCRNCLVCNENDDDD